MFEEENPMLTFNVKDDDGNVVYRDSLTFPSINAMRSTTQSERQKMMVARYKEYLRFVEEAQSAPQPDEEVLEEEPEEV